MAVVGALPSLAQSVEEQLQRGIYTQQTAGDLDSAIRIFRQIIASNPTRKVYAAQAQVHLAQALLQKGDLDGVGRVEHTGDELLGFPRCDRRSLRAGCNDR